MTYSTGKDEVPTAVLVGVQLPGISDFEQTASLQELERLVTTLGYRVIGQMSQKRKSTRGAEILGPGKLAELARWTGGSGVVAPRVVHKKSKAAARFGVSAEKDSSETEYSENDYPDIEQDHKQDNEQESEQDSEATSTDLRPAEPAQVVIFDCDLSPSQLRNLDSATGAQVMDRTGVIIEIFNRHARTRASRMQVEIARLTYMAPRIRETTGGEDRGGGGVGGKGAGETSVELDRRRIRDRIKELKQELESIGQEHLTRRNRREQERCVALVGYTNAGKSSLMRALTGSEVLVANKLFATLDTTVRAIAPETRPKILISDTVGFIKKLPHDLVASFKSTLDEALNASLLLYVVDGSDPSFRSQLEVTKQVLSEVGAGATPNLLILNKRDCLTEEQLQGLKVDFPDAVFVSTRNPEDIAQLREKLILFFEQEMVEEDILIPYTVQAVIGDIRSKMRVLGENYNERGVILRVRATQDDLLRIKAKLAKG
jgi:GTP-binding protein HflX